MTPAALALSSSAMNSSKFFGSRAADLVHHRLVDPDPVDRVDVDGNGVPLAVGGGELLQRLGDDLVPAFLHRQRGDVAELAGLGVVDREIAEDLRSGRRIAGRDHRLQRGHRAFAAAAGDRHVLPGVAFLGEILLEDVERGRFAARGPPVQHLHFLSSAACAETAKPAADAPSRSPCSILRNFIVVPSKATSPMPDSVRRRPPRRPRSRPPPSFTPTRDARATSWRADRCGRGKSFPQCSRYGVAAKLAAEARLLESAERQFGRAVHERVGPHRAGAHLAPDLRHRVEVAAPHARRQPVGGLVGERDRLVERSEGQHRRHRAEHFVRGDRHRRRDPVDDRRRHEQAGRGEPRAAEPQAGARPDRARDMALDLGQVVGADRSRRPSFRDRADRRP